MEMRRTNRTGTYKIASRQRSVEDELSPGMRSARRVSRIVESLRAQIVEGGVESLRIRCVLRDPREIYRLELELPEFGCQRMTLLDRDALEELLACAGVRERVRPSAPIEA